jgi:hypothetical protein
MAHFQLHLQTLNGDDKSQITPSYLKLQILIPKASTQASLLIKRLGKSIIFQEILYKKPKSFKIS